jgi:hypothetical protein
MDEFTALLNRFTAAVETGDGAALAALFTPDGVYHDTFYGAFRGNDAIGDMLENLFYRDADRFLWDMRDPVFDGARGYARWVFSYSSRMPDSDGKRVVFEGMSCFDLEGALIRQYDEVFSAGIAFAQLGMHPDRAMKIFRRQAARTLEKEIARRHRAG